jgi:hypothetical protein
LLAGADAIIRERGDNLMLVVLDVLLILHFIGLMLGAGGGLGSTVAMGIALKMPPEQGSIIRSIGPSLARLSAAGLVLMLVSGISLVVMKYNGDLASMPALFWAKMFFVTTLTIAVALIEMTYAQVKKGNGAAAARLPRLGPMAGMSAFLATILAVLTFH